MPRLAPTGCEVFISRLISARLKTHCAVTQTTMTSANTLPFELTQESLAVWLDSLTALPHFQAANQLNLALKSLKNAEFKTADVLPALINLTPLTLLFSNSLSLAIKQDSAASEKSLKLGKLSMQLPRQLALLFCQLNDTQQLSNQDQQTAIYYALQLIGYSLRYYSLFYEVPSNTLWKKSAELYKQSVALDALNTTHTSKINDFKPQSSIGSVIKRNLLFSILNPSLHATDEINPLFQLANQHGYLLEISSAADSHEFGFYWDLQGDQPPCPIRKPALSLPNGFMAINAQHLSHELHLGTLTTSITHNAQNKLALLLSGYRQVFHSITPGLPSRTKLIAGFKACCQYLQELDKLAKINQLSSQHPHSRTLDRNFSLVPLEHQRNVFENSDQTANQQPLAGQFVNLHKTPNKQYSVAERRNLDCLTGDIVLLYKEQHPVSIAIIRQQALNDFNNSNQLLLEHLPGSCLIYSLSEQKKHEFAIVIAEDTPHRQVFLPPGKYTLNSNIQLLIDKSLQLTACLESNSFYARFRFNFV